MYMYIFISIMKRQIFSSEVIYILGWGGSAYSLHMVSFSIWLSLMLFLLLFIILSDFLDYLSSIISPYHTQTLILILTPT